MSELLQELPSDEMVTLSEANRHETLQVYEWASCVPWPRPAHDAQLGHTDCQDFFSHTEKLPVRSAQTRQRTKPQISKVYDGIDDGDAVNTRIKRIKSYAARKISRPFLAH